jgi:hypothetical protein
MERAKMLSPRHVRSVGWVEATSPAFGRPDDKLRETHQFVAMVGFASL